MRRLFCLPFRTSPMAATFAYRQSKSAYRSLPSAPKYRIEPSHSPNIITALLEGLGLWAFQIPHHLAAPLRRPSPPRNASTYVSLYRGTVQHQARISEQRHSGNPVRGPDHELPQSPSLRKRLPVQRHLVRKSLVKCNSSIRAALTVARCLLQAGTVSHKHAFPALRQKASR